MLKKFPDLKSDDEADAWLQRADLAEYDLTELEKVRFELAQRRFDQFAPSDRFARDPEG
jgi:hypothetical protein